MEIDEIKKVRLGKLESLRAHNISPYGLRFTQAKPIQDVLENFTEEAPVTLAGRLMAFRSHGKVCFADLMDQTGRIQLFIRSKELLVNGFEILQALDIGDIVGIKGKLFITKMGEKSVRVEEITMLSKSLMSLPEKWHGLKDIEIRYRQRHVDLISNEEVRKLFIRRSKAISLIRSFLDKRGFLEVET